MRIWLLQMGEPVPVDGISSHRLQRMGLLAKEMAANGGKVTWWTSTFDHISKAQAFSKGSFPTPVSGWDMHFVEAPSYPKNICLRRIVHNLVLAARWRRQANQQAKPDLILSAMPIPEFCYAATWYGAANAVPTVVDIRDLWPDDLVNTVPRLARPIARSVLLPMEMFVRHSCRKAAAILAVNETFVDWGLAKGGRGRSPRDGEFPLGYPPQDPAEEAKRAATDYWRAQGIDRESGEFIACYFGTVGWSAQLEPVIHAARKFLQGSRKVKFVICGKGDRYDDFRKAASDCPNMVWPGWLGHAEIWTLMRLSAVGLVPYQSVFSLMCNFHNKSIEYMAGGLPILSSLRGVLQGALSRHGCGLTYENGDANQLDQHLCRLYDEPELRLQMAAKSAELFQLRFRADTVYGGMARRLREVVDYQKKAQD